MPNFNRSMPRIPTMTLKPITFSQEIELKVERRSLERSRKKSEVNLERRFENLQILNSKEDSH